MELLGRGRRYESAFHPRYVVESRGRNELPAYHVVVEIKKYPAALIAEGNADRVLLNSMVEHLTKANELLGEMEMVEPEQATVDPPGFAEFLLTALLKPAHADAVTGDLNERFTRDCEELGRRRAVWRYWARTLYSLWPLLRRAIGKAVKWGVVIDTVRRHF
jgi:hypothetical protein